MTDLQEAWYERSMNESSFKDITLDFVLSEQHGGHVILQCGIDTSAI